MNEAYHISQDVKPNQNNWSQKKKDDDASPTNQPTNQHKQPTNTNNQTTQHESTRINKQLNTNQHE